MLVTGSRYWVDRASIESAMLAQWDENGRGPMLLIHGGAEGADKLAQSVALQLGWEIDAFPADWKRFGRVAGPIRNSVMVVQDPDVCLGFPLMNSRGTYDCMTKAYWAGVPVLRHDLTQALMVPWAP